MSTDLDILEATAHEALYRTAVVEDRVSALESVTGPLSSTARLVTSADIDLLRDELNELWTIVSKLQCSVQQMDAQLNSLSVNQLL